MLGFGYFLKVSRLFCFLCFTSVSLTGFSSEDESNNKFHEEATRNGKHRHGNGNANFHIQVFACTDSSIF